MTFTEIITEINDLGWLVNYIRQHTTLLDRFVIDLHMVLPFPTNNIECHLTMVTSIG